ncbi:hypothetical protein, partial [Lactobacillus helveticus]|uniref:hypothetical protein n=1 Tax=Lactobacillus helveticus TaxID=1587 RepID=UPI001C27B6AC
STKNWLSSFAVTLLIENNFSEYFNSLCINGMKDRYYVFILRFRHVPFVLKMDAFIYHIVKLKK